MTTGAITGGRQQTLTREGIFHLLVVYVVWGSTFLGMRVSVAEGSGFPPFTLAAIRLLVASPILLLWMWRGGQQVRLTRREFFVLLASGVLLWNAGHGAALWAVQYAESAYGSVIFGSVPIWVAVYNALIDRRMPSRLLIGSLLIGLGGLAVLTIPTVLSGVGAGLVDTVVLLIAAMTWAGGIVVQQRNAIDLPPQTSSGYQQLFGGIGFLILMFLFNEPTPQPEIQAWVALVYLIVFGSLLAFTSFVTMLQIVPRNIAITYAYVNPVVAVFLGWLILSEPITSWRIVGVLLVVIGVAGVFRDDALRKRAAQMQTP